MDLSHFDFDLPPERIAQHPAARREASRLLVIPAQGDVEHRLFPHVVDLLRPGDVLVRNDTRVLPARLIGRRDTGGRAELLLLGPVAGERVRWLAMAKPGRAMIPGRRLNFGSLTASVEGKDDDGTVTVVFDAEPGEFEKLLAEVGRMPLPPYIRRADDESEQVLAADRERYQTIYAVRAGAAAAPTAGLHFTDAIFAAVRERGIDIVDLTLHVGAGTFLPIRTDNIDEHRMHTEWYDLSEQAAARINRAKQAGGRIIAVGTTSSRVLESQTGDDGVVMPGRGETDLFIKPGYRWRAVDALITNFHLPKSTLIVLVCALAGVDRLLAAYREAIARGYRFFSYGDACWIERA